MGARTIKFSAILFCSLLMVEIPLSMAQEGVCARLFGRLFEDGQIISKSFEFRYYDDSAESNGETDFKGPTSVFDTDERIEFLRHYAEYAGRFYGDPDFDTLVVDEKEVLDTLAGLKEQPSPEVRQRIPLERWGYAAVNPGESKTDAIRLQTWLSHKGTVIKDGALKFTSNGASVSMPIPPQTWRFFLSWRTLVPSTTNESFFSLGSFDDTVVTVGFDSDGIMYYYLKDKKIDIDKYDANRWYDFNLEVDLTTYRYNLYINGELKADYIPLQNKTQQIALFSASGVAGETLDDVWGVGYYYPATYDRTAVYHIDTFIDEDFEISPSVDNWYEINYNDEQWDVVDELPLIVGSERNAGRDIYMRKVVSVGNFERAFLNIDALDPGGEVYINGKHVAALSREPIRVEVGEYLSRNENNLIAIKVNHVEEGYYLPDGHTSDDLYFGWFAGRMSLDLTSNTCVEDLFVYTTEASKEMASVQTEIEIENRKNSAFEGSVEVEFYPWYPEELNNPGAVFTFPLTLGAGGREVLKETVQIQNPRLWTFDEPNLYRIRVVVKEKNIGPIDDFVVTTGLRTIGQEGGTFRINGEPQMLNGALIMQFPAPLTESSTWHRCAPDDWVVRQILMAKKMNANCLRMHIPSCAYSDPRFAEYGDQLGIGYIWVPTGWNREDWAEGGSRWDGIRTLSQQVSEYITDIKQVRNHPSIMIWEIFNEDVPDERKDGLFNAFYPAIRAADPSRLIAPLKGYYPEREGVAKGAQEAPLGYGGEWSALRNWPGKEVKSLLDSEEYAFFVFEHGEIIGQHNWDLVKGKPWYLIPSFEWEYDIGSIGRKLEFDEWAESQAWQAFAGYEVSKKFRLYGVDGMLWCPLRGGGNSVTYMKPLIDFDGHAKQSFYSLKTVFQKVLAASDNVDIVYGPDDSILPVVMNLGDAKNVEVIITVRDAHGNEVESKVYKNTFLPAGRSVVVLPEYKPEFPEENCYGIEYMVRSQEKGIGSINVRINDEFHNYVITDSNLPQSVQQEIKRIKMRGAVILNVELVSEKGEEYYEIDAKENGEEFKIRVDGIMSSE